MAGGHGREAFGLLAGEPKRRTDSPNREPLTPTKVASEASLRASSAVSNPRSRWLGS